MLRRHGIIISLLAIATTSGLPGCGGPTDDLPRSAVSGSVTLDGKPVESGSITFDPDGTGHANPVTGGALISGGSYSLEASSGLTPGPYRVAIISGGGGTASTEAPGMPPKKAAKDPIPSRYNSKSTLKIEVKGGGSHREDFALTSE